MATSIRSYVVDGKELGSAVPDLGRSSVAIPTSGGSPLYISDELMHQHVLVVGSTGQGKSNAMYHLLKAVRNSMGQDDIVVVFDTKRDYLDRFWQPGDYVIRQFEKDGDDKRDNIWNLLADVRACGADKRDEVLGEIGHILFDDMTKHTREPFFPKAAQSLFTAGLRVIAGEYGGTTTNQSLVSWWRDKKLDDLRRAFDTDETRSLTTYINEAMGETAMGVMSFLYQAIDDVFVGRFREPGDFSMIEAVRHKGGRAVFIEYDVSVGKTQSPAYRIMMDLAIKEALGRDHPRGRTFFFIDEFSLLPQLHHFANGLHFGREANLSFVVGMQSHAQVTRAYEEEADAILAGFNTVVAFRVTDAKTREFIKELGGHNYKYFIAPPPVAGGHPLQQMVQGYTIGDHDIWDLNVGQAIVFMRNASAPFRAQFVEYRSKG